MKRLALSSSAIFIGLSLLAGAQMRVVPLDDEKGHVALGLALRPDVVISLMPTGAGGGQHHQASAVLTHDAVNIAGDSTKYREQLKDGLRPWQPKKFYFLTGFGFASDEDSGGRTTRIDLSVY